MKQRGSNDAEHRETHGPNNAGWVACRTERHDKARIVRAIVAVVRDLRESYDDMAFEHGLMEWSRNGLHGHQHAYGVKRLHRNVEKSLINLAERLEED